MATFVYDKWATGETITADGLNGGKARPVLTLTSDDFDATSGTYRFELDTEFALTALDFVGMIVCRSDENGLYIEQVTGIYLDSNNLLQLVTPSFTIEYQAEVGIFTASE